jgi:hypothetical protein
VRIAESLKRLTFQRQKRGSASSYRIVQDGSFSNELSTAKISPASKREEILISTSEDMFFSNF